MFIVNTQVEIKNNVFTLLHIDSINISKVQLCILHIIFHVLISSILFYIQL